MKIGILTFYNVANYGAALQAWALREFLMSVGHDVDFVNHTPSSTADNFGTIVRSCIDSPNIFKRIIKAFVLPLNIALNMIKIAKYRRFVKHYLQENKVKDSVDGYDVIVVGSDQVWNYKLTGGFDDFFWGNASVKGKKPIYIAYAASINLSKIDDEDYVRKSLCNFRALSVREKTAVDLLSKYTETKIDFVCDPTCLVNRNAWSKIVKDSLVPKEKYLLIYPVGNVEETIRIGRLIAKKRGLKVIQMMSQINMHQNSETYYYDGPEGFVSKLSAATVVVTSSFHGTILSAIFNRDFYSIKHSEGSNDRAFSLLSFIGIENRLVSSFEECLACLPIDYCEVNRKLNDFRKHSSEFLIDSLNIVQ